DKQHGKAVKELMSTPTFQENSTLEKVISFKNENENPIDKRFLSREDFLNGAEKITDSELDARRELSCYPDEVAIIMYSSGSTGSTKGGMLTDDMLLRCSYGTVLSRSNEARGLSFAALAFALC